MTDEELTGDLEAFGLYTTRYAAARIRELSDALNNATRNVEVLIGNMEAHKDCAECQESAEMYLEAVAEYRATLAKGADNANGE